MPLAAANPRVKIRAQGLIENPGRPFFSMKPLLCGLLWLGIAATAPALRGGSYIVLPKDAEREAYFRAYLAACGPNEVRCVWFLNNDIGAGMKMTLNLQNGAVDTARDVFEFAEENQLHVPGKLSPSDLAAVRQIIATLPPSQDIFPMAACVCLAAQVDGKVKTFQYNLIAPPAPILRLYKLGGGNFISGEPDLRDEVTLTSDQVDKYRTFSRPWPLPRVLEWYQQAKDADARKFWAHVLAASCDPRAALALAPNLGQGDQSADVADFCEFFSNPDGDKNKQTLAAAQQWLADNHTTLAAKAALLSGLPAPAETKPVSAPAAPPATSPTKN